MSVTKKQLLNLKKGWKREIQLKNLSKGWNNREIQLKNLKLGWEKNKKRKGKSSYSDKQLSNALFELQNKLGKPPIGKDLKGCHPSLKVYLNRFGTWTNALRTIGIKTYFQVKEEERINNKEYKRVGAKLRFKILKRDGFRCFYCGATPEDGKSLHVDHKVPPEKGGKTVEDNLITACWECNIGKSNIY